jgi:predicted signal transduction protein with EAL and GGDEF domain
VLAIGILAVAVTLGGLEATRARVREATGPADRARQEAMDMRISVADSVVGVTEYLVSEAIVRAVHQVARSIGAQTVAEFVEDEALLERVRSLGIDYAQGHAIDRPRALLDHLVAATPRRGAAATD